MGRSGISKEQVKNAMDRLMSRGQPVTVDSLRAELGNTGSKGTIHRHLKEIRNDEDNKAHDGIVKTIASSLVDRLTLQLQRETQEAITQAELGYKEELDRMRLQLEEKARCINAAEVRIVELEAMVAELRQEGLRAKYTSSRLNGDFPRSSSELSREDLSERSGGTHPTDATSPSRSEDHRQTVINLRAELEFLSIRLAGKEVNIAHLDKLNTQLLDQVRDLKDQLEHSKLLDRKLDTQLERDEQGNLFSPRHAQSLQEKNDLLKVELEEMGRRLEDSEAIRSSLESRLASVSSELSAKEKLLSKLLQRASSWMP